MKFTNICHAIMAFLFRCVIRNSLGNIVLFKMLHKNYSGLNAAIVCASMCVCVCVGRSIYIFYQS